MNVKYLSVTLVLFVFGSVAASGATYTWSGGVPGVKPRWSQHGRWIGMSALASGNETDVLFHGYGAENVRNNYTHIDFTLRSITYKGFVDGVRTAIWSDEGHKRTLTFAAASGNASSHVHSEAMGLIRFTDRIDFPGEVDSRASDKNRILLRSNLDLEHTSTSAELQFDVVIDFGFIRAGGVNQKISGTGGGKVVVNNRFQFDLSFAGNQLGDCWVLVDSAKLDFSYGEEFLVEGFTEAVDGSGVWLKKIDKTRSYQFEEATGVLSVISSAKDGVVGSAVPPVVVRESSFCQSLVAGDYILPAMPGSGHWGMAPCYDEDGVLHVFVSSTPLDGIWTSNCVIKHYTAESVDGPYEFIDTPFSSPETTYHNPQISKIDDIYVLVFAMNVPGMEDRGTGSLSVGMATAKSLYGPWEEDPSNPLIKPSGIPGDENATHVSNPSLLVDRDGKYRIYYKAMSDRTPRRRTICVATADRLGGPYINDRRNPLISYEDIGLDIEDPYVFFYEDMYYMILEDRTGVRDSLNGLPRQDERNGGFRPGLMYRSKDGFLWGRPEIANQVNSFYFGDRLVRNERPHILWKNGIPECLFITTSTRRDGISFAGYYLRINGWAPDVAGEDVPENSPSCDQPKP